MTSLEASTKCFIHIFTQNLKMIAFLPIWCFFYVHSRFTGKQRKGGVGALFNPSPPLPLASPTLRHQSGDYLREPTTEHSLTAGLKREPFVSGHQSLITTRSNALTPTGSRTHAPFNTWICLKISQKKLNCLNSHEIQIRKSFYLFSSSQ